VPVPVPDRKDPETETQTDWESGRLKFVRLWRLDDPDARSPDPAAIVRGSKKFFMYTAIGARYLRWVPPTLRFAEVSDPPNVITSRLVGYPDSRKAKPFAMT
jgi:hypothetical protein